MIRLLYFDPIAKIGSNFLSRTHATLLAFYMAIENLKIYIIDISPFPLLE